MNCDFFFTKTWFLNINCFSKGFNSAHFDEKTLI